jgi:hypothetical protein
LAITLFSLSNVVKDDSTVLSENLRVSIEKYLRQHSPTILPGADLTDVAQLLYAANILFPKLRNIIAPMVNHATRLLNSIPHTKETETVPSLKSCKEICLLWSFTRLSKPPKDFLEALYEASRGLRLCRDFNQNKAGQLAEVLAEVRCVDPRAVYQVIHFVDKNWELLNGKNLFRIINSFGKLRIDNDIALKKLARRLECKVGLTLTVPQLRTCRHYMSKFAPEGVARRTAGILDLYIKTKNEAIRFGQN